MFVDKSKSKLKKEICPVNKMMEKLNDDHKDSSRLKLNEIDIFDGITKTPSKTKKKKKKKRIKS